jgi:hypothetical protein
MSLINDALKRARDSQSANPAPPAASLPPLAPVEPANRGGHGWIFALATILFFAAICLLAGLAQFKHKNPPVVAVAQAPIPSAPPVVTASVAAPAPVASSAPVPAASQAAADTNQTAAVSEPLPKVQGVIFNTAHPLAIVSGKTVGPGDRVGVFLVKNISPSGVTFQRPDGSLKKLGIGE